METIYLKTARSTQIYLEDALKTRKLAAPICVWTLDQTDGIGSRDNLWQSQKGNLAFSFAIRSASAPADLPPQSASIYFGFIFKETLAKLGSKIWLKWPNDLYLGGKKAGGAITKLFDGVFLCGIGLNFAAPNDDFAAADIAVKAEKLLADYLLIIERAESWGAIFSRYRLEYQLSRAYAAHSDSGVFSLENAVLEDDGSVRTDSGKVYSLR